MSEMREELTRAYAEHGVDGAEGTLAFRDLCEGYAKEAGFGATINRVRDVAVRLEKELEKLEPRDQVEFALKWFHCYRSDRPRRKICAELVRLRYWPQWTEDQRDYYDQASEKLEHWRDYFLSFTNFNPTEDEVMFVNNEHRCLIDLGLGRSMTVPAMMKENLLARLLNYRLKNAPLDGFFYPEHRDPERIEERYLREARACFAFVQLVQNSMFGRSPNCCQSEFEAAREDGTRTLLFVLASSRADLIDRHEVVAEMHEWHETITAYDAVALSPVTTIGEAQQLVDTIHKRVVEPVRAARMRLFERVPE